MNKLPREVRVKKLKKGDVYKTGNGRAFTVLRDAESKHGITVVFDLETAGPSYFLSGDKVMLVSRNAKIFTIG